MTVIEAKKIYFEFLGKVSSRDLGSLLYNEYNNVANKPLDEWHKELFDTENDKFVFGKLEDLNYQYVRMLLLSNDRKEYLSVINKLIDICDNNKIDLLKTSFLNSVFNPNHFNSCFKRNENIFDSNEIKNYLPKLLSEVETALKKYEGNEYIEKFQIVLTKFNLN